jgi:integrase
VRHTPGHVNCPVCDSALQDLLKPNNFPEMKFKDAAAIWLEDTRDGVAPRTHRDHQDFVRRLNRFFGEMIVKRINAGNIAEYQRARQGRCLHPEDNLGKSGPETINHEISAVLSKILDAAGTWKPIKPMYKRLKVVRSDVGRSLTQQEEERLVICAASHPRWRVAYLCSLLSVNTTAGPGEIARIRVRYINLREKVLSIEEGLKNHARLRHFPMTESILWTCEQLLERYYKLCKRHGITPDPDHYVMPGRARCGPYDPWRPIGSWRKAFERLREKADLPKFRRYDLRHQSQTKLMEQPDISDHTIEDISGHVPGQTKKRYRHIRDQRKLEALQRIEVRPAPILMAAGELLGPTASTGAPQTPQKSVDCSPVASKVTPGSEVRLAK